MSKLGFPLSYDRLMLSRFSSLLFFICTIFFVLSEIEDTASKALKTQHIEKLQRILRWPWLEKSRSDRPWAGLQVPIYANTQNFSYVWNFYWNNRREWEEYSLLVWPMDAWLLLSGPSPGGCTVCPREIEIGEQLMRLWIIMLGWQTLEMLLACVA